MPKKQQTEKEKKQSREKPLRREFGNSPSYTNKNDLKYYNDNKERNQYGEVSYMVQSGPAIAKQSPSIYGLVEQQYPRIGFYTYMPKNDNNLENDEFRDYIGKSMLYRWDLGSGFLNARHEPEVAVPGEKNYPRIVQEFVDLSNISGHPAYVGQSPELSKQLPELVVTPKQKYFIVRQSKGGSIHQLIPKHQQGNRVTRIPLRRNFWQVLTGEHPYIDAIFHKDTDTATRLLTFDKVDSRDKRKPFGDYARIELLNGQLSYPATAWPSWRITPYGTAFGSRERTEDLEKEATNNYIQQHNGELPWWYEGNPESPYELDNLTVTSKGTPFTRTYDWYNSGHKYPYTITENVGIDRNGNDSIMSSFMINPQGDSLYNTGQFPEMLSPKGEAIFNNRLIQKNNTKEAKQRFMEDYRRTKKTITY